MPIKVFVVDWNKDKSGTLIHCINRFSISMRVTGCGEGLSDLLSEASGSLPVDVVVFNMDWPISIEPDTWFRLRTVLPEARFLVLTNGEDNVLRSTLGAGVAAIHGSDTSCRVLRRAILRIHNGLVDYDPVLFSKAKMLLLRPLDENEVRLGGLVINKETNEVSRWGTRIDLTQLEQAVLTYMAERVNKQIELDDLLDTAWTATLATGGTRAQVKNCIHRLRKKIEPVPNCPRYIKTVRGHGYMLVDPTQ